MSARIVTLSIALALGVVACNGDPSAAAGALGGARSMPAPEKNAPLDAKIEAVKIPTAKIVAPDMIQPVGDKIVAPDMIQPAGNKIVAPDMIQPVGDKIVAPDMIQPVGNKIVAPDMLGTTAKPLIGEDGTKPR